MPLHGCPLGTGAAPVNLIAMSGRTRSKTIWLASGDESIVAPVLTLRKFLGTVGWVAVSDQFSLRASDIGAPGTVTTTGASTAVASGPLSFVGSAGASYTLDEVMAADSATPLSRY